MHIPDGYLSPETCAVLGAGMVPVWSTAGRKVKRVVKSRYVPLVAMGAASCFLVMMFNIPVPDGTTAHAVGAVLIAVLLGPWAAVIAVSIALLIQALFFGDGGVLAYGANCCNMAFVMPFTGYGVYRLVARNTSLTSARRALAAGIGGYVGLNAAAFAAAVELGIQPSLFHAADGTPLYAPFHLSHTIPAMALAHLTVAGGVEAVLTVGVISYLQRANLPVLRINHEAVPDSDAELEPVSALGWRWACIGLGVMTVLTPLGLLAPGSALGWRWACIGLGVMTVLTPLGLLAPGGAFGEDAPEDLDVQRYGLNAVPSGLRHYAGFWHHAIFDGYDFTGDRHPVIGYLVSAGVGILFAAIVIFAVCKLVGLLRRSQEPAEPKPQPVS